MVIFQLTTTTNPMEDNSIFKSYNKNISSNSFLSNSGDGDTNYIVNRRSIESTTINTHKPPLIPTIIHPLCLPTSTSSPKKNNSNSISNSREQHLLLTTLRSSSDPFVSSKLLETNK
ncbi:11895_t:CDS:1, partial [Diversispora eburnea]